MPRFTLNLPPGTWRRICARDGWVCQICGEAIDPGRAWFNGCDREAGTADHLVPHRFRNDVDFDVNADDNLRAAHFRCNMAWRPSLVEALEARDLGS